MSVNFTKDFENYKKIKVQTAESNYLKAELYYMKLRKTFEKSLKDSSFEAGERLKRKGFEEIIQEGISKEINYQELINQYQEDIEKELSHFFQSKDSISLKQALIGAMIAAKKTDKGKERMNFDPYWDKISKAFDDILIQYFGKKEIQQTALTLLNRTTQDMQLGTIGHSVQGTYSFFKRVLLTHLAKSNSMLYQDRNWDFLSKKSKEGYSHLIAGYLREVLTNEVINDFLNKNNSTLSSFQTNDSNMYYDLVIGNKNNKNQIDKFLIKELEEIENLVNGQASIDTNQIFSSAIPYFGIQAKSWKSPDDLLKEGKNLRDSWFKIGDRQKILNQIPDLNKTEYDWNRGWHNSVAICSKIIYQLIGQYQVAYSLPGRLIWTYDLIRQMHENKLFLSFYFKRERSKDNKKGYFKYPATEEVAWQKQMYLYSFYTKSMFPKKK